MQINIIRERARKFLYVNNECIWACSFSLNSDKFKIKSEYYYFQLNERKIQRLSGRYGNSGGY